MALPCCDVRCANQRLPLLKFATWVFIPLGVWGADATTTIDYSQRNSPFAPSESSAITPDRRDPKANTNDTLQQKRVEPTTLDKKTSPLGDRRAPLDVTEAREKNVREKDSHRPEAIEQPKSGFDQRKAKISTSADTSKPPTVTKYQNGLTAASTSNKARFPAVDGATGAKINRFVFRKNPAENPVKSDGTAVQTAAGGSPVQK